MNKYNKNAINEIMNTVVEKDKEKSKQEAKLVQSHLNIAMQQQLG